MDVCEIRFLEYLPPTRERFGGIGVASGKTIQRFLLDDVHLGVNIATCYIYVNLGSGLKLFRAWPHWLQCLRIQPQL